MFEENIKFSQYEDCKKFDEKKNAHSKLDLNVRRKHQVQSIRGLQKV